MRKNPECDHIFLAGVEVFLPTSRSELHTLEVLIHLSSRARLAGKATVLYAVAGELKRCA